MKKDIQPKTYNECVVTCACGNTFTTISTVSSITVDICSACHPFYTGQRRFVDTERRIDKFNKKIQRAEEKKKAVQDIKKAKEKSTVVAKPGQQKEQSIKEILQQIKSEEESK
jgi:large subunit ribosomal protein L31